MKRIYDDVSADDGARVLVDHIWPRGISKARAQLTSWNKHVAPTTALRTWYSHDAAKFNEFARRYRRQLRAHKRQAALDELRSRAAEGTLTLLTATKQENISHALVLRDVLLTE